MGLNEMVQTHRRAKMTKSVEEDQPIRQKSGTIQYQEIKTYYETKYGEKKE